MSEAAARDEIRVVRLRFAGQMFQVPVYHNRYVAWRASESQRGDDSDGDEADAAFKRVLVTQDQIWRNASRRERMKDADVRKAFPRAESWFSVIRTIISHPSAELIESQEERDAEKHRAASILCAVVDVAFVSMLRSRFTGELLDDDEQEEAAKAFMPALRRAVQDYLSQHPTQQKSPSLPTATAAAQDDHQRVSWILGAWFARKVVAESSAGGGAATVNFSQPVLLAAKLRVPSAESISKTLTKIKALLQRNFPGLARLVSAVVDAPAAEPHADGQPQPPETMKTVRDVVVSLVFIVAGVFPSTPPALPPPSDAVVGKEQQPPSLVLMPPWIAALRDDLATTSAEDEAEMMFDRNIVLQGAAAAQDSGDGSSASSSPSFAVAPSTNEQQNVSFFKDGLLDEPQLPLLQQQISRQHQHQHQSSSSALNAAATDSTTGGAAAAASDSRSSEKPQKYSRQQRGALPPPQHEPASDDDGSSNGDDDGDATSRKRKRGAAGRRGGGGGDASSAAVTDRYSNMTHAQLQKEAKKAGLATGGSKNDLLLRLRSCAE